MSVHGTFRDDKKKSLIQSRDTAVAHATALGDVKTDAAGKLERAEAEHEHEMRATVAA